MGDVLYCTFTPKTTDTAKERIRRRRAVFKLDASLLGDLTMARPDPEMPCDSAYSDPA